MLSLLEDRFNNTDLRKHAAACSISVLGLLLNVGVKLLMTYSGNKTCCTHGRSMAAHSPMPLTAVHLQVPKTTVRSFCQKLAFGDVCKGRWYQQRSHSECDDGVVCVVAVASFVGCPLVPCRVPHLTCTGFPGNCVYIIQAYTVYLFVLFLVDGHLLFLLAPATPGVWEPCGHRSLFCSPVYPECLAWRWDSITTCWMNERVDEQLVFEKE